MSELLSYCGQICSACPIYVATNETDKDAQERMRTEIAKSFEMAYGIYFEASDIGDCDGCKTSSGKLFSVCYECKIRKCAKEKLVKNCAHCTEYICKELEVFFKKYASAKEHLDEVRDDMYRSRRQQRDSKYR